MKPSSTQRCWQVGPAIFSFFFSSPSSISSSMAKGSWRTWASGLWEQKEYLKLVNPWAREWPLRRSDSAAVPLSRPPPPWCGGAAASGGRRAGEGHRRGIRAAERPLTCPRVHQLEILFLFPQATSPGPPAAFSHGRRDWGGRREKERKNGWPYLSAALGWWRLHVNICVIPSRTLEAWIYLASLGA